MNDEALRMHAHIRAVVLARFCRDDASRAEALSDYLAVSCPSVGAESAKQLAALVPPVLPKLYAGWAAMFADRLLETVPIEQIRYLCDGSRENETSLLLAFLMYLESETMERRMAEDLATYGLERTHEDDGGSLVADYIRARMARFRQDLGGEKLH